MAQFSCSSTSTYRTAQPNLLYNGLALPPTSKNGECYTKYITIDKYKTTSMEYAVYTGNELSENKYVETKTIVTSPKSSKWVRKKKYPDCVSSNPPDCYVACYEEIPEVTKKLNIVTDTIQVKDFQVKTIESKDLIEKGGQQMWLSVVCQNKQTPKYIQGLQMALQEAGTYDGDINGKLSIETLESLKTYQADRNLPVGLLDLESMESLGLSY